MLEQIKMYRALRRRKPHGKVDCPICKIKMKRKGKKGGDEYFKCPKCKGKMRRGGPFVQPVNPDTLDIRSHEIKAFRKELSKRKLIVRLKKQKYLGYKSFEWEGQIINLDDYDFDGMSFEEKRKIAEEEKKRDEAMKKEAKKKKRAEKRKEKAKAKEVKKNVS